MDTSVDGCGYVLVKPNQRHIYQIMDDIDPSLIAQPFV
jgi:hypothetical protein